MTYMGVAKKCGKQEKGKRTGKLIPMAIGTSAPMVLLIVGVPHVAG
jgi:hypothetical protein